MKETNKKACEIIVEINNLKLLNKYNSDSIDYDVVKNSRYADNFSGYMRNMFETLPYEMKDSIFQQIKKLYLEEWKKRNERIEELKKELEEL